MQFARRASVGRHGVRHAYAVTAAAMRDGNDIRTRCAHKPIAGTNANAKNTEGARDERRLRTRGLPGAPVAHRVRRAFLIAAVAHGIAHWEYRRALVRLPVERRRVRKREASRATRPPSSIVAGGATQAGRPRVDISGRPFRALS
ncbi:hypothetical protein C7S17_1506 [Burkholderia thailandensis]|nr:hypothetical protein [Burkholderia thailandensis]